MTFNTFETSELNVTELAQEAIKAADAAGVPLRLLGALAVRVHSPEAKCFLSQERRIIKDLDFAGYRRHVRLIVTIFRNLGLEEDLPMKFLRGRDRRIFRCIDTGLAVEVYLEALQMCHVIRFSDRLELESPTIPLSDLLLSKLQVVHIERYSHHFVDLLALLMAHQVVRHSESMYDVIDADFLAAVCARNWGLCRTVLSNLNIVAEKAGIYVDKKAAEEIQAKAHQLSTIIKDVPKSIRWQLRNILGNRLPSYQEVEFIEYQ